MTRSLDTVPPWAKVTVVAMCGTVASLQFTLVIPLLPELTDLLHVSDENASWLMTATLLTSAVSTPIVSRAADMYGKRLMLVASLAALTVGSLICALGSSFAAVLVGRSLQGFAASLIAVGISLLRDELPPDRISSAVALMSATLGVGSALGLPLAGILSDVFGWHAIFWFTAVTAAVLIAGLLLLVRESPVLTPGRFDLFGALLLSVALVALLLPITKGATWGWTSPAVVSLATFGVLMLAAWVPFELRVNQPMVDLPTAGRRPVLLTNLASGFSGFAMFVNMLLTARLLQLPEQTGYGFGLSVFDTGLAMVPSGLAMVVIAPLSGALLDRWGGRATLILGTAIMTVTYIGRVFFSDSLAQVIVGATLVGIGTAIAFAAMPALIMSSVPVTETAAANGLNTLVRSLGTSIASAVVVAVLTVGSVTFEGEDVASAAGVRLVLWLAAMATLVAGGFAWFIPRAGAAGAARKLNDDHKETLLSGRVGSPKHS